MTRKRHGAELRERVSFTAPPGTNDALNRAAERHGAGSVSEYARHVLRCELQAGGTAAAKLDRLKAAASEAAGLLGLTGTTGGD